MPRRRFSQAPSRDSGPTTCCRRSSVRSRRRAVMVVRVFDGEVRPGMRIRLMATGKEAEVVRLAVQAPSLVEVDGLGPGEVGVVMAGLKEVVDTQIGDTLTEAARPTP